MEIGSKTPHLKQLSEAYSAKLQSMYLICGKEESQNTSLNSLCEAI